MFTFPVVMALLGAAFLSFIVFSVVRMFRRQRAVEAMLNEYRELTDELVELQKSFAQKYHGLTDEQRAELWQPVSDEVMKSIDCITAGLSGELRDPRPDMRRALEVARAIVQKQEPGSPSA